MSSRHRTISKAVRLREKPEDLKDHRCILLKGRNNEAEWHLVNGRKSLKQHVSGPLSSRDFQSVAAFTYRGHGIGLLPSTYCDEQIKCGELIRLLPDWSSPEDLRACGLSDPPVSAGKTAGLPR